MLISSRVTPINDDYPTCERTSAELRIYTGSFDPTEVTTHLRIEPSQVQKLGEVRKGFRSRERTIKLGGWFLSSEGQVQSRDLRRHLDWLLERLMPAKADLILFQEQGNIQMGVHCIWWSVAGEGGPTLWPEQMRALADLNLECSLDVAFFGSEETE